MAPLELLLEVAASNVVVAQGDISLSSSSLLLVAAVVVWFVIVHWGGIGSRCGGMLYTACTGCVICTLDERNVIPR